MTVIAVSMVKDEADIIVETVEHMLTQVDHVIVADNGSSDGTRDLLADLGVEIVDDAETGYYQAAKMTALAHRAIDAGADWVVPFDADEIWGAADSATISSTLATVPAHIDVAIATLWDHVPTGVDAEGPPVQSMRWRKIDPAPLHKVACRAHPELRIEQGNHTAHHAGRWPATVDGLLAIRHFPYRTASQFVRKVRNGAAAYAATELPESMGAHWRDYGRILERDGEEVLIEQVFRRWFWRADPTIDTWVGDELLPTLIFDPAPCRHPSRS